jgi:putative transcriptional regulator
MTGSYPDMLKTHIVASAIELMSEHGFRTVDCTGSRSSFDLLAKRGETLILLKTLSNVEGLSRDAALELKSVASLLGGVPLVVSQRMKSSELADDTLYDRYGVGVCNLATLRGIVSGKPPAVHSTRGNYFVKINAEKLSRLRQGSGLTQDSIARKLGVSKQSVYRYERHGRVTLDVFQRLVSLFGDGFVEPEESLHMSEAGEVRSGKFSVTSFKRMVYREFEGMGFDTVMTSAPFDMVATGEHKVFGVISNDWRRLSEKLEVLEEISEFLGGYSDCICERKVKAKVSVLSPRELAAVKSPHDLFKLLSE